VFASGFTNISDLAFDGESLLVLEMSTGGLLDARAPGAFVRVDPNGRRTVLTTKLHRPTGLAVSRGAIYVSNDGTSPDGEILRLSG